MYKVYCDGSVRGNPGIGGVGISVERNNVLIEKINKIIEGTITSNEAEYYALLDGIKAITRLNIEKEAVEIYIDSKLVYNQLFGGWKINFEHLRKLNIEVKKVYSAIDFPVEVKLVGREHNSKANKIAQKVTQKEKRRQNEKGFGKGSKGLKREV